MNKRLENAELLSQFYKRNHCAFFTSLMVSVLTGTTGLIISRIIKELIDLISGQSRYTLGQLFLACLAAVLFVSLLGFINYHSEPRFVRRAMRQYKDKAFALLTSKNISAFGNEKASDYLLPTEEVETKILPETEK